MSILQAEICGKEIVQKFKVSVNDFTRKRKQSFSNTIIFMLNILRKSLALEIENFTSHLKTILKTGTCLSFTKSAFVQCRKKIQPDVFKYLNQRLIEEFYTDNEASVKLWKGYRLLSVDGSCITLPDTKELAKEYGCAKNQTAKEVVQARASVLYDVLNRYVLDAELSALSTGEKILALKHLHHARYNDLIIYDRGYPSFDFIYEHNKTGIDFLIRVKKDFSNVVQAFSQSGISSRIVKIYPCKNTKFPETEYDKNTFVELRLVRVELSSNETEILMTSLKDDVQFPDTVFKKLYGLRWGIETLYNELKNKLKLEYFSGYSKQTILQDFYATVFVSNIKSLIVGEINDELREKTGKKYEYKVNSNLSYGFLKDRIISMFFSKTETDTIYTELRNLFEKHLIPIRPGRKYVRNKNKYKYRPKPKVPKNMKDTV